MIRRASNSSPFCRPLIRLFLARLSVPTIVLAVVLVSALATGASAQGAAADSVRKYKFLGKTARDKSDHAEVVKYYTRLLDFQPDYHAGHYYIARAHLGLGNQAGAKKALLAAVALKPKHANTNLLLFQVYAGESQPDSAWIYLAPLVAAKPGEAKYREYRRTVADLLRRAGNVTGAIEHYQALATDAATPDSTRQELIELLAVLYDDQGDPARALAWRQKLTGSSGADEIESMSKTVDLQVETKDYAGAWNTLKTLTRIDSAGRYSHFVRMSELGERIGKADMRLSGLEGMARSQPKDVETVATIAQIHLNAADLAAAESWLQRGLRQVPMDAQLHMLRGDLLMRREAHEDTIIAEYEVALQDPNWAAVAQQRIWQIRPPETEEEKLRKSFFGQGEADNSQDKVGG